MPILLFILGILGAAAIWYWRIRQAGEMAGELKNAALDVRNAARRFGFNRKTNVHPAESIEDARVSAMGVVLAVAASDGALTATELETAQRQAVETFGIGGEEAGEMVALARWTVGQCGNTDNAIYRLSRRTRALAGMEAQPDLERMARTVAAADTGAIGEQGEDALLHVGRHFRG